MIGRSHAALSRRRFCLLAGAGAMTPSLVRRAAGQPAGRPALIGYLRRTAPIPREFAAFRDALAELGLREGRQVVIEQRYANGDPDRLRALAAELVSLGPNVLAVDGVMTVKAAMEATRTVPIVFAIGSSPEAIGITSLNSPDANVTGILSTQAELYAKRLQILKEVLPGLKRLAVLGNPANRDPAAAHTIAEAARVLALETRDFHASAPRDWPAAFAAIRQFGAEALVQLGDATFASQPGALTVLAAQARLPVMYAEREFVDAGGLMSYGVNLPANWQRAASLVDRILRGARPGSLPVEQPSTTELVVNEKCARELGIVMPPSVLLRADEVIE